MTLSPIALATARRASASLTRTALNSTPRTSQRASIQRTTRRSYAATGVDANHPHSGGRAGIVIGGIVVTVAGLWYFAKGDAAGGGRLKEEDTTGDKVGNSSGRSSEKPESKTKVIDDAKGGQKKRVDSGYQTNVGEDASAHGNDKAASAKKPGSMNTTSGKQAGLTNTDTRHATDISKNSDKSTKGEGTVETAKLQGSVDPGRRPG